MTTFTIEIRSSPLRQSPNNAWPLFVLSGAWRTLDENLGKYHSFLFEVILWQATQSMLWCPLLWDVRLLRTLDLMQSIYCAHNKMHKKYNILSPRCLDNSRDENLEVPLSFEVILWQARDEIDALWSHLTITGIKEQRLSPGVSTRSLVLWGDGWYILSIIHRVGFMTSTPILLAFSLLVRVLLGLWLSAASTYYWNWWTEGVWIVTRLDLLVILRWCWQNLDEVDSGWLLLTSLHPPISPNARASRRR